MGLRTEACSVTSSIVGNENSGTFEGLSALFYRQRRPVGVLCTLSSTCISTCHVHITSRYSIDGRAITGSFTCGGHTFILGETEASISEASARTLQGDLSILIRASRGLGSISIGREFLVRRLVSHLLLVTGRNEVWYSGSIELS